MAELTSDVIALSEITAKNSLESPLLRLPPELRLNIYDWVFTEKNYVMKKKLPHEYHAKQSPGQNTITPAKWHGFISVCRQINDEAACLPYTLNAFRVEQHRQKDCQLFLECLRLKRQTIPVLRLTFNSVSTLFLFAAARPEGIKRLEMVTKLHGMASNGHQRVQRIVLEYLSLLRCRRLPQFEFEVLTSFSEGDGGGFEVKVVRVEQT